MRHVVAALFAVSICFGTIWRGGEALAAAQASAGASYFSLRPFSFPGGFSFDITVPDPFLKVETEQRGSGVAVYDPLGASDPTRVDVFAGVGDEPGYARSVAVKILNFQVTSPDFTGDALSIITFVSFGPEAQYDTEGQFSKADAIVQLLPGWSSAASFDYLFDAPRLSLFACEAPPGLPGSPNWCAYNITDEVGIDLRRESSSDPFLFSIVLAAAAEAVSVPLPSSLLLFAVPATAAMIGARRRRASVEDRR